MQTKVEFCKGLNGSTGFWSCLQQCSAVMPPCDTVSWGPVNLPRWFLCLTLTGAHTQHCEHNTTEAAAQRKSSFYLICGFAERWANVYSGGRVVSPLTWIVTSDRFVKIIQCTDVLKEQFIEAAFEKLIGSQQQRILWTSNLPPLGAARKQLLWSRSHSWRFDKQWGEVGWRVEEHGGGGGGGGGRMRQSL